MKIALVQQHASPDTAENLARGLKHFDEAAAAGARLVCFAELAFEPFHPQRVASGDVKRLAETIPGRITDAFGERARRHGVVAVLNLFERVHLGRGVYIPVHDVHGTCGAVGFGGDREVVNAGELKELTFIASYLFGRLSEIREIRSRTPAGLSRREIECLHWAAAGKTTTEMAKILDLSEYTVNHYLSRATRKLDSVNRVQTVAKAIRAGLIN